MKFSAKAAMAVSAAGDHIAVCSDKGHISLIAIDKSVLFSPASCTHSGRDKDDKEGNNDDDSYGKVGWTVVGAMETNATGPTRLHFIRNDQRLVMSCDRHLFVIELKTWELISKTETNWGSLHDLAIFPGTPLFVSAHNDSTFAVWNDAGSNRHTQQTTGYGWSVAASTTRQLIATGHQLPTVVYLWDASMLFENVLHNNNNNSSSSSSSSAATQLPLVATFTFSAIPRVTCFTQSGKSFFAGDNDGQISCFDTASFEKIVVQRHGGRMARIACLGDRHVISAGWDGNVLLTDTANKELAHKFTHPLSPSTPCGAAFAVSPRGDFLVCATASTDLLFFHGCGSLSVDLEELFGDIKNAAS